MAHDLVAARARFVRRRDWLAVVAVYAAHTVAGLAGRRTVRCRVPLPADPVAVTIRLGSADFHTVKELYHSNVYGFALPRLAALVPPLRVVVDLGANIGLSVRL